MTSTSGPTPLTSHHRTTMRKIFQHPVSHNIEWHDVVSLLEAVGSVDERRSNKIEVTVGSEKRVLDPPRDKDIDEETVVYLRDMLSDAGYGPEDFDDRKS